MKLLKKLTMLVATLGVIGFAGAAISLPAAAANCSGIDCVKNGANTANTGGSATCLFGSADTSDPCYGKDGIVKTITNVLLFLIGAISVIMIIIGGIKYTTSNGNAEQVKSAKNTIMYSIVGILVAIFAYAIVNFIIKSF